MTMNDEELFEHLQELVAELPAMQEKGAVLARAGAAAEVAKRAHYYEGQQNELNGILSEMAEHERQRAIAIEQGDCDREEAQRALILTCGTQRGIRKGAADAAKRELDQALSDGGFAQSFPNLTSRAFLRKSKPIRPITLKRSPHVSELRRWRRLRSMRKVSKKRKLRRDLLPHGLRALQ